MRHDNNLMKTSPPTNRRYIMLSCNIYFDWKKIISITPPPSTKGVPKTMKPEKKKSIETKLIKRGIAIINDHI